MKMTNPLSPVAVHLEGLTPKGKSRVVIRVCQVCIIRHGRKPEKGDVIELCKDCIHRVVLLMNV